MADAAPRSDLGPFLERVALPPGWRVVYEPIVGSTMDLAREAARRGWPQRSVFVCDYQTAGRGRQGRRWEAPPGLGLLFTMLLPAAAQPLVTTMLASVALCEAIRGLCRLEPMIKWPNDLMLDGRKAAGILAETLSGAGAGYALVGCGMNVNQDAEQLAELGRAASSLRIAGGFPVHRGELLALCIERADAWLRGVEVSGPAALRAAWSQRLWGIGQHLRLRDNGAEFTATIEAAADDGSLVVRLADGSVRRIVAGEIVL